MSLLTIVQDVCGRIGLPKPNAVATTIDAQVLQLLSLLNEEGEELAARYDWQSLTKEATFSTVAAETQAALTDVAPNLRAITNDTIWNRDLRRPVFGPLAAQRWQQQKAMSMSGPWNQFRVREGSILFIPAPSAGQHCYFEYVTKAWVTTAAGNDALSMTADDDVPKLDDGLLKLGLTWRWKAAKGFTYAEDFNKYERRVLDAMAQDGSKDILSLGDTKYDIFPGIVVPSGSWGV